jgi:hypothetical protein
MMVDTTPIAPTIPNTIPTMMAVSGPLPPLPPGLGVLEGGFVDTKYVDCVVVVATEFIDCAVVVATEEDK